jgi:hypothetical protein
MLWEYLVLDRRWVWEARPTGWVGGGNETEYVATYKWTITRPGGGTEKFDGWSKQTPNAKGLTIILNELGAEGWELVSTVIARSIVVDGGLGWVGATGMPIEQTWTLKRPA